MRLNRARLIGSLTVLSLASLFVGCGDDDDNGTATPGPGYKLQNLVANDGTFDAETVDENLVNPWGIAFNPTAYAWVANNESQNSTLYDGNGVSQDLVVSIPEGTNGEGKPTGIVFNSSDSFPISESEGAGGAGGAGDDAPNAVFIWATQAGTLAAWNPDVDPTKAVTVFDDGDGGASYFGLAIGKNGDDDMLYAADFANGKIDVFNSKFEKQDAEDFEFKDPEPLQDEFKPFNVAVIGGKVFVAYAKSEGDAAEEVKGDGLGFIDVFEVDGTFDRHFTNAGALNAPWAMVRAPDNFGELSGDYLIGNFGDGKINAYDADGVFVSALEDTDGDPINIEGLWGLAFGNDQHAQPSNTLFFAAGPNDESDGVYGRIDINM